ncbi:MAG: Xaa-Pro aminopeptidase [Bdellovibrionaceae bacterium]|nr:Xaa-Pro aminopeptidase [Pseudobdellovibrionaceae bacterium]
MRTPLLNPDEFVQRRQRLAAMPELQNACLILPANPEVIRNQDNPYNHRQESNFFYATGFEEAGAIFVMRPGKDPESVLFVNEADAHSMVWTGFRFGTEGAVRDYKLDAAFSLDEFCEMMPQLLMDVEKVYYQFDINPGLDHDVLTVLKENRRLRDRRNSGMLPIFEPMVVMGEQRLRKSPLEIQLMKESAEVASEAHIEVMKYIQPGMNEREIHGRFMFEIMKRGAAFEAYTPIVAGGANGTVLHYKFNDAVLNDGDMLLIDAGADYKFHASDITRTYPIGKAFTETQKRVYQKVLDVQKQMCQAVKPGVTFKELYDRSAVMLTEVMVDEGLLKGSVQDLVDQGLHRRYYPHGLGHWLGLDVHDIGSMIVEGSPRKIEQGFCLTIEPGIYVPADDMEAPEELRGLAIRIEDDLVVTADGNEIMTAKCPKDVDDLESLRR